MEWLEHLYTISCVNAEEAGIQLPGFEEFWQGGALNLESQIEPREFVIESFRRNPDLYPLKTPSGKIEIFSQTIADFDKSDCPGHPVWMEKEDYLGAPLANDYPLHLISAQPKNKLHSQFDFGRHSLRDKSDGREVVRINPVDAAARRLQDGQLVRIFNHRGACLAAVGITADVMPGVVCLRTGAWFDPDDQLGLERHGNPNVLTPDRGTSSLAQGPIAHSCLVQIEAYEAAAPDVMSFTLPEMVEG
jgi:biotin/methionine sulfoxide reductase